MLSRSFTKAELQLNQLKHKHLPPQIDFALLQDNTLKPVHYLIKHEEILPLLAPVIRRQRNSIQNLLVEKQNLNSKKLR